MGRRFFAAANDFFASVAEMQAQLGFLQFCHFWGSENFVRFGQNFQFRIVRQILKNREKYANPPPKSVK